MDLSLDHRDPPFLCSSFSVPEGMIWGESHGNGRGISHPINQMPLVILPGEPSLGQSEPSRPMLLPHRTIPRYSSDLRVKSQPFPRVKTAKWGFQGSHHAVIPSPSYVPCLLLSHQVAFFLLFLWVPLPVMLLFQMCEADSFPHKTQSSKPPARAYLDVQSLSSFHFWASPLSNVLPLSYSDSLEEHTHTLTGSPTHLIRMWHCESRISPLPGRKKTV